MKKIEQKKNEHRDDFLNRIVTDPFADAIKLAFRAGFSREEVVNALRSALLHGVTEDIIDHTHPDNELPAERNAYAFACQAIPKR